MAEHKFSVMINHELFDASCALLKRYEELNRIKYIESPKLKNRYMEMIGFYENDVIVEEIEVETLLRVKEYIQAAINRRESIDEETINAFMEDVRKKLLYSRGAGEDDGGMELSAEEEDELQTIYRNIIQNFHPQTHPHQSEVCNVLFDKAHFAYKNKDLELLRLIYQMLVNTPEVEGMFTITLNAEISAVRMDITDSPETTDFSLAKEIFNSFVPTVEEAELKSRTIMYMDEVEMTLNSIDKIKRDFPFNAEKMLNNPDMLENYRKELEARMHNARNKCEELQAEISRLKEKVKEYGESATDKIYNIT